MISKALLFIGITCLALYGFANVQAYFRQAELEEELYQADPPPVSYTSAPVPAKHLNKGDLFGRLEIPRLDVSVMVMEGEDDRTLRLGAGHVPGPALAIAGHRDTFFRSLKDIKPDDEILLTTPSGVREYRVTSAKIVEPSDTAVLENTSDDTLALITCYPFYYIGPAPKRFIVEAKKN
jgi:sortase A